MSGVQNRRHWPELLAAALCLLCACTPGVGTVLDFAEDGGPSPSEPETDSGRDMDFTSDESPKVTPDCRAIDAKWPQESLANEKKLVDLLNALRTMPGTGGCAAPPPSPFALPSYSPLETNAALRCTAQLRFEDVARNQLTSPGYSPGPVFSSVEKNTWPSGQSANWDDRRRRANVTNFTFAEFVISGAPSVQAIANAIKEGNDKTDSLCRNLGIPDVSRVGVAHIDNVWVIDLGSELRPGRPNTGGR